MMRRGVLLLALLAVALFAAAPAVAVGPGVITGTVSPASIAPEVEVCVVESQPSELCTAPEPGGNYQLTGVPVGPQRVEFVPSYGSGYLKQYFDHRARLEEATSLQVSAPPGAEIKGIDADLELGSVVEGIVRRAPGGVAIVGVEVCVQGAGTGITFGCSLTGVSGAYAVGGLPAGVYKVDFRGQGATAKYAPQFYAGEETFNTATAITVPAASTVTGIDAELVVGARVEGSVTAATTGGALSGIPVCLLAVTAATPAQCVFTEPTGAYSLVGIPAGDYQVGFALGGDELGGDTGFAGLGYVPQYFAAAPTRAGAQVLSLGLGQVDAGVDAALYPAPLMLPPAPVAPASGPSSSDVGIVAEPAAPKKKQCRRAHAKKASKHRVSCAKKRASKKKKRRHRHRRTHRPGQHAQISTTRYPKINITP